MEDKNGIVKAIGITNILLIVLIVVGLVLMARISVLKNELQLNTDSIHSLKNDIQNGNNDILYSLDTIEYKLEDIEDVIYAIY